MSQNVAHFSSVAARGMNKVGKLKRTKEGYYEVVLGGFGIENASGAFYEQSSAERYFATSEIFKRRMSGGNMRSEYGHPVKLPGESDQAFFDRYCGIDEKNVCQHIKHIRIDKENVRDIKGNKIMAIIGLVSPCGPYGAVLEKQLLNQEENVCYSVRSLTKDKLINGRTVKYLHDALTWDYVNEGGIQPACKYSTPSMESVGSAGILIPSDLTADTTDTGIQLSAESREQQLMVKSSLGWAKVQDLGALLNDVPTSNW